MKMELKDLYNIARNKLSDIVPVEDSDFRLEQAEYNKKDNFWEIVVSYLVEKTNKPMKSLANLTGVEFKYDRIYKTLKINQSGEVDGFCIYNK